MNSTDLIKLLVSHGWCHVSTRGSHHKFFHPDSGKTVIIPHPKKDLSIGVTKAILKQANLK